MAGCGEYIKLLDMNFTTCLPGTQNRKTNQPNLSSTINPPKKTHPQKHPQNIPPSTSRSSIAPPFSWLIATVTTTASASTKVATARRGGTAIARGPSHLLVERELRWGIHPRGCRSFFFFQQEYIWKVLPLTRSVSFYNKVAFGIHTFQVFSAIWILKNG